MGRKSWLIASIAIGLVLVASICFWHVREWPSGELAGWVSGIGALVAAVIALKIADDSAKQGDAERTANELDRKVRAVRRARRIRVQTLNIGTGNQLSRKVIVRNAGSGPIYNLTWHAPVVRYLNPDGTEKLVARVPELLDNLTLQVLPNEPVVALNADEQHEYHIQFTDVQVPPAGGQGAPVSASNDLYLLLSFEDEDGFLIGRGLNATASKAEQEWIETTSPYPDSLEGLLSDLIARAEPRPPTV